MTDVERATQDLEDAALRYTRALTDLADSRVHGIDSTQYRNGQQMRDQRFLDLERSVRAALACGVLVAQVARIVDWSESRVRRVGAGESVSTLPTYMVSRTEAMTRIIRELQNTSDEHRRAAAQWERSKPLGPKDPSYRSDAAEYRRTKEEMRTAALRALDARIARVRVERITGWSHVQMWRLQKGWSGGSSYRVGQDLSMARTRTMPG